jgi:hypothetical protein
MDCLRDKRLYLPSLRQVEGPYILLQGRQYLVPKRPIRGEGKQGSEVHQSIMMDTWYIKGVMVMKTKRRL